MYSITWLDPRLDESHDDPLWAVWETECGTYRIDYDGDAYTPQVARRNEVREDLVCIAHVAITKPLPSFEEAQDAVNRYHCQQHNLVLDV